MLCSGRLPAFSVGEWNQNETEQCINWCSASDLECKTVGWTCPVANPSSTWRGIILSNQTEERTKQDKFNRPKAKPQWREAMKQTQSRQLASTNTHMTSCLVQVSPGVELNVCHVVALDWLFCVSECSHACKTWALCWTNYLSLCSGCIG